MMLWDKNGTIRRYETAEEIIQDFYGMRLQYYGKRRAFLIKDAEGDLHRLNNRMRFILEVIGGKMVVNNRRKKEIEADLEAGGYDKLLPNKPKVTWSCFCNVSKKFHLLHQSTRMNLLWKCRLSHWDNIFPLQMGGRGAPEPTAIEGDNASELVADKASYDYLLSMPIWSLTLERVQALKDEADKQTKEVQRLKSTAPEELWVEDLDAFLVVGA